MRLWRASRRSEGTVTGSKTSGGGVEVGTEVEREGIRGIPMARNGRSGGIDQEIGLATSRETGQATDIRIEGSGREAMIGEGTMRGCLDDIGNEVSRQAHTDGEDTPETEVTTTEDEIADRVKHDPTASSARRGSHSVQAWGIRSTLHILPSELTRLQGSRCLGTQESRLVRWPRRDYSLLWCLEVDC